MRGWLPALRIARREARRAKGRSALVVAMIAVPVLALSFAAVSYDMFRLTPEEKMRRSMGAADGRVRWPFDGPARQDFTGDGIAPGQGAGPRQGSPTEADLLAALPPGSRAIQEQRGTVAMRTPAGVAGINIRGVDVADPMLAGRAVLLDGRAPAAAHEVALTEKAVDRLGARTGGTVELAVGSRRFDVVGIVEFPEELTPDIVFTPGPTVPGMGENPYSFTWLVDTPEPLTWSRVKQLNEKGIVVTSREVTLHRPPDSERYPEFLVEYGATDPRLPLAGLVFGLGVLEVILLAGPAFVVGARRRQRQLALVAANGGTPAHVRRIVLADGVVLGVLAAGAGIALGIAVAFAGRPLVEWHLTQSRAGGYRVFPPALLAIGGLAVVTGLVGALVPAFVAGRQDVVAALSGRRGTTRSRKRWLILGLAMAAAGAGVAGYGAWTVDTTVVLGGLVVGEIGIVLCTPALVGLIARAGRFLPLAPRIALRDTARNRAAAAPAISAVMAAVAGAVALGVYLGSSQAQQSSRYVRAMPLGGVAIQYGGDGEVPVEALRAAVRDAVPVARLVDVYTAVDCGVNCSVRPELPPGQQCPFWSRRQPLSRAEQREARRDKRCDVEDGHWSWIGMGSVVDDGTALPVLTGATAEQVAAATAVLRAGGVVLASDLYVVNGTATLSTGSQRVTVPAYVIEAAGRRDTVIYSRGAADRVGLPFRLTGVAASTTRMPTTAEQDHLNAAADKLKSSAAIERGPQIHRDPMLVILAIAAGVITLGAAGIATGLAAADGRADLSTLAAVGASPRLRRVLSLSQSGVIAGLGAVLGAAAGLGAASAVLFALNQVYSSTWPAPTPYPISVPWLSLGIVLVVVPAVAMLGAGLLTRSRLPIERRMAT